MKMFQPKKGQFILYGLLAGIVGAVLVAVIASYSTKDFGIIGSTSFKLLTASKEAEEVLLYIDQSAEYSLQQAIYDLAQNGGVVEKETSDFGTSANHDCEKFNDAYVWYEIRKVEADYDVKDCFDERNVDNNIKYSFNKNLNQYLQHHPNNILTDNYEYELRDNLEIIGKALKPLIFRIPKETEEEATDLSFAYVAEDKVVKKIEPITTKLGVAVSYKYGLEGSARSPISVVDTIVLHHSGDDKAYKTFNTLKSRGLSIHYIIDRDGTIYYVLDENKKAIHAANWNSRSIGIEIVNTGRKDMEYTNEQYASIKALISDIAKRWPSIKIDDQHVVAHYQISNIGKWDPSPNFDWGKIGLQNHPTLLALGKKAPAELGYA